LKDTDAIYLPDEIKSSFENSYKLLNRTTKQNELKEKLEKLDDFDGDCAKMENENLILVDNVFKNIIKLYDKYKNDTDCVVLIEEYIQNKIKAIINNKNKALRENNHQNFLNNCVLICTINIELSPIMNSFEQINVEQIETQCLNMVRNNFERLHESLDNRIKSLDSKLSNNKINYSSRYKS
jgi:hypothetical protein